MQRGIASMVLVGVVIVVVLAVGGYFLWQNAFQNKNNPLPGGQKACTLEAMVCSDGSSVGRTGPNCEFAPCPSVKPVASSSAETANWKSYTNKKYGFEFEHGLDWTEFIDQATYGSAFSGQSIFSLYLLSGQTINNHEGVFVYSYAEVLNKPSDTEFKQWLENTFSTKSRQNGDLNMAYKNIFISKNNQLTYKTSLKDGIEIYEYSSLDPSYFYAIFFNKPGSRYAYVLTLRLLGYGNEANVVPTDSHFLDSYKKMTDSFKIN